MRNKRIKKINEHINYYTCHLNTSRSTISSVLRVSLCVAYELTQGKKAVQSFITKCRNEPTCWIFFSHKSFAYSVKIMSVSKRRRTFAVFAAPSTLKVSDGSQLRLLYHCTAAAIPALLLDLLYARSVLVVWSLVVCGPRLENFSKRHKKRALVDWSCDLLAVYVCLFIKLYLFIFRSCQK